MRFGSTDTATIKAGDLVCYVPRHAKGDLNHPEMEHGIVKRRAGDDAWFVNFYGRDGALNQTAQNCPADLLRKVNP